MFYNFNLHKTKFLCFLVFGFIAAFFSSCDTPLPPDLETFPKSSISVGNSDVFVMTNLKDIVDDFDYNLYEDKSCTNKALYNTASYFFNLEAEKFYFSNQYEYDTENQTLFIEVIKNPQANKDRTAFLFSNSNGSYLTTLKITGLASIMTEGKIEVFENSFNSTDYKKAWDEKTESYEKLGNLYYKVKEDFTTLKNLPAFDDKVFYLLDSEDEYVKTLDNKSYCVKFGIQDITRSNHKQNLYQITSDTDYWYFGFSETSRESFNKAIQDNYLNMPAIVRVSFSSDNTKITISDSLYLSQAKPTFEVQDWTDHTYTLTDIEPTAPAPSTPEPVDTSLEDMKGLLNKLLNDASFRDVNNPDGSTNHLKLSTGTVSSATTIQDYFKYFRLKGQVKGKEKYKENTISKPADDLYTDEIFTDGTDIYVIGHLATSSGNAAPKGAVYAPNDADTGKFALWVITSEGVKTSQLFATLDECKTGNYEFALYSWK